MVFAYNIILHIETKTVCIVPRLTLFLLYHISVYWYYELPSLYKRNLIVIARDYFTLLNILFSFLALLFYECFENLEDQLCSHDAI